MKRKHSQHVGGRRAAVAPPQLLQQATTAYARGRWAEAEAWCRQILAARGEHVDALTLLGVIAAQSRRNEEAVGLLQRAVAADPGNAAVHNNYGNVLRSLGRPAEALASYERALALQPDYAEACNNRGIVLRELNRPAEALDSYARALQLRPGYGEAYHHRGNALLALGRPEEALESYQRALELKPDYAEAYDHRGTALYALGRRAEAVGSYDQAIALRPGDAGAYDRRGTALYELGRFAEALSSYEAAIALRPDFADAYHNRGNALDELGRFEDALASYERALELKPDGALAYCNRGTVLQHLNRCAAAIASFDRAIAIDGNFALARYNRSLALLLAGDFEEGWSSHEWRWKTRGGALIRRRANVNQPLWLGGESLAGKTLLLVSEQGLGDTLMFCRYAPLVAELGARVILDVPAPLAGLMSSVDGVTQVTVQGESLPAFDYYCPLMSLPLAFRTTLASVPARVPYLQAPAERLRQWRERLGVRNRPRVGLVWSGGFRPNQPELWGVNRRRNIPLALFAGLRDPQIEFFSLQKGQPAEAELTEQVAQGWDGPPLVDLTGELHDFTDTAALVAQLDLVITADTAVAHLAGALGKPVWILNRFDTDWRWLLGRTDSPWYPTATLYRQERAGDWEGVLRRVSRDLKAWAASARNP